MVKTKFDDDIATALSRPEFLQSAPTLAQPTDWCYRVERDELEADLDAFSEVNRERSGNGLYSPIDSEKHFACFLFARPQKSATCEKCGGQFQFLSRWHYRDEESPPPKRCRKCEGEYRKD